MTNIGQVTGDGLRELPAQPGRLSQLGWLAHDSAVMAKRSLTVTFRRPAIVVFAILQPAMFVLVFRFVFGGAIHPPGHISYIDYLMAGILVQTTAFNAVAGAMGFAAEKGNGIIDRFRTLPMSHGAILIGRITGNLVRNLVTIVILVLLGWALGFSPHLGIGLLGALCLLVVFGFALSWVGALLGLTLGSQEAAQSAGFVLIWPLVFVSSAFVPPSTMPSGLRAFVSNQFFTRVVDAERDLLLGHPTGSQAWLAVAWCLGIGLLFMLLAARTFGHLRSRPR